MSLLISKAVSQLLLPPGILILLGIFGFIFWKKWWGRAAVAASICLLWLLSTAPVRDMLIEPLEQQYPAIAMTLPESEQTAIVLLGGGVYEKAPEYGGRDQLASHSLQRTVYAADLAIASGLPVIATGGTPLSDDTEPEGEVMRRWLIRLNVPAESVTAESLANNTWENAVNLKALLQERGCHRIVLVTSAWHMPRSAWCFAQQGLEVIPAPADYLGSDGNYDLRSYLPDWGALNDSALALREYLGIIWYRIRY